MEHLLGGCAFLLLMVAPVLAVIAVRARFAEAYGEITEPGSSETHRLRATPDHRHDAASGAERSAVPIVAAR